MRNNFLKKMMLSTSISSGGGFEDGFEFADGWPGTVENTNPQPVFTTASEDDGFEAVDGWPGT